MEGLHKALYSEHQWLKLCKGRGIRSISTDLQCAIAIWSALHCGVWSSPPPPLINLSSRTTTNDARTQPLAFWDGGTPCTCFAYGMVLASGCRAARPAPLTSFA